MLGWKKTPSRCWRVAENRFKYRLRSDRLRDHSLEQDFNGHGVRATLMSYEELTITHISAIIEGNMVIVVITVESEVKFVEQESISFFSIALCLFSLAD